ncbi:MAG: polysaccharide deacetylase family protein, partial [Clostridia bacterium]
HLRLVPEGYAEAFWLDVPEGDRLAGSVPIRVESGSTMNVYPNKLLQLISIANEPDDPHILVKLCLDEPLELVWKLDKETADHLSMVVNVSDKAKYRLSLQSAWDPVQNRYYSTVTKTLLDQSEKLPFACSHAYIEQLQHIKNISGQNDLPARSSFLAIPSRLVSVPSVMEEPQPQSKTAPPRMWRQFAMISIAAMLLMGFSSYSYLNVHVSAKSTGSTVPAHVKDAKPVSMEVAAALEPIPTEKQIEWANNQKSAEEAPSTPQIVLDQRITYSLPADSVALSFDDGPSKYTKAIVDILHAHEVGGTFFFTGNRVQKFPAYVAYAHSNGFTIGNHSMSHGKMTKFQPDKQDYEIHQTRQLIEQITSTPSQLFRPPYGAHNQTTEELLQKYEMKMVLWNRDPEDWRAKTADDIFQYVVHSKAPGSVILLHETPETVEALPKIIEYLKGKQVKIVSLR